VDSYKFIDGKRSKEKQNWYRDDYIKFIRFAQDKMAKVDEGIVAVITNHSFLSNITMPGMRQSLLNSFDQIYFVNLHGSAKKEEPLDGNAPIRNVFDIEQGVSISFFIKKKGLPKKVFYTDFWGSRKEKYQRSLNETIDSINWEELTPATPNYFFIPRNEQHGNEYYKFFSVTGIFKVFSLPLMTGRDPVAIHDDVKSLEKTLKLFTDKPVEKIKEELKIEQDTSNWTVLKAKNDVVKTKSNSKYYRKILYRPFDKRITYFTGNNSGFHSRPQMKVNSNMLLKNIGLLVPRQLSKNEFKHVFCADLIPEMCAISTATKEQNQLFPLYLYINASIAGNGESVIKEENFTADFRKYIEQLYGKGITAEEIFGCIYAILHSPTYRKKYIEFLKIEFARIPFPKDKKIFKQLAELGNELIQVHLIEEEADYSYGDFIGKGTNIVEKLSHVIDKKVGKLYINKIQYFTNVPLTIWNFHIGGYQVLDKYLKERKGRALTIDEVEIITSTIKALAFTIDQMIKIDTLTKNWI
jgi:predicted helicase